DTQNFLTIGIILTFCLFYLVYYILKQENHKRNQSLKEVQESEMRFKTMANNAPVMLGIADTMGRCTFVNQSWLDFTGSTLEKELDDGWANHLHPDDQQHFLETSQTAFAARESFEMEYRLKSHSGAYHWILNKGAPRWLADGSFAGYISSSVDINDAVVASKQRQQALQELRQKELRYRSLLTATTQIIWTTNAQGEVVDYMPGWGQVTGQNAAQMKGWGWLSVLHPDDQEHTSQAWTKAVQTRSLYEVEHRLLTRDGSYRDFSVRAVPVLDDNGEILEWVGTHIDITEKKQAESELHKSHNLLQTVIEGTPDAIFAKDLEGRFLLANSMTATIMGKPVEELLDKDDRDFLPPEMAQIIRENDRQIMTTGESQIIEEEVLKNGNLRIYLSAKSPWQDDQGNVIGLVGIARDITERKLAEQEIKQLNEDLERRVIERTAELTAANQELEAFSYSVSHDLRAPLRGIDGFSQALADRYSEQLDDKGKHYLNRIRAGTQRMGELIDDLLTLSRVTRTEMRRKAVDLSAIATEIATELKFTEPDRDVEFAIAPGLNVNGDAQLLRVVLENLLNNAWKFTSASIQTKIEFGGILQADAKTAYFISDNGAGFDMAYSNKLFGAFQRLHSTTQFPGTGIGLATVQRIIHRHGGKVWAEGAVEQGATFYFTL
ncbi:MAG: PAS domain S-box protein, partial [Coleofasciculaceae cyanobacterium]